MAYYFMKSMHGKNRLFRSIIAALAALFIVLHGRWNLIAEAVVSPAFYFAFLTSFGVTYLLLYIVHIGSIRLDNSHPWHENFYQRFIRQTTICFLAPALIDLVFAGLFLHSQGRGLIESGFMLFDFPAILFFLLLTNLYYFGFDYIQRQKDIAENQNQTERILAIQHQGVHLHLNVSKDIFCLIKEGRYITVITVNGDEYQMNDTLHALQQRFENSNLYRINRSTFVNMDMIQGIASGQKRRTLEIILKPPFNDLIGPLRKDFLVVTKENIPHIQQHFDQK